MTKTTNWAVICAACFLYHPGASHSHSDANAGCSEFSQLPCACENTVQGTEAVSSDDKIIIAPCYSGGIQNANFKKFGWFSAHSWIAINWPAKPENGKPDYGAQFPPVEGDNATVWEYWKTASDVFLPDGSKPSQWTDKSQEIPAACQAGRKENLPNEYDKLKEAIPDGPTRLLTDYVNGEGDVVVDRNQELVRYETIMNEVVFNYIVSMRLYSTDGQQAYFDSGKKINFPPGNWFPETRGSYFLKAAWKILGPNEKSDDVHKAWAYIYPVFKNGRLISKCELRPVGLLGLHVIYKDVNAPQWGWATFEHKRNAPQWHDVKRDKKTDPEQSNDYFLFDRECVPTVVNDQVVSSEKCVSVNTAPQLFRSRSANEPPLSSQIVMLQDFGYGYSCEAIPSDCNKHHVTYINSEFKRTLLKSVWKNYLLKGTQWVDISRLGQNPILPVVLANSAIESYAQATSSCIECHITAKTRFKDENGIRIRNAHKSDLIFVLQRAKPEIVKVAKDRNVTTSPE